jgi:hypothetical protein
MKFASVNDSFFELCRNHNAENELLYNTNRRPYLIILSLKYNGTDQKFALPFRSDISPNTPKAQYFPLPPRPTTRPGRRHGLHYIKLFPIDSKYLEKFRIDNDSYYEMLFRIISRNERRIVSECQEYLANYERNGRMCFAPDIDKIIEALSDLNG